MSSMRSLKSLPALFLLANGCTGHVLEVGDGGPIAAGPFTAAEVQSASAACAAPHGAVTSLPTTQAAQTRLEGAWYDCTGNASFPYVGSGVFGVDGHWHALVSDGDGGLVEGNGLVESATYSIFRYSATGTTCDDGACGVDLKSGGGGETQLGLGFEMSPTRALLGGNDWLVPLGD